MTKKITSGVHQYYYCVASIVVALLVFGMTTAQAANDIKAVVDTCSGAGYYYTYGGKSYYSDSSDCWLDYVEETIIFALDIVLFSLSFALLLLAIFRMYQVQKSQQTRKVEIPVNVV